MSIAPAPPPAPAAEGPAAPAPPEPIDEGSPAQTIELPRAPSVTVRPRGPALIEVVVAETAAPAWKTIEVERRAPSLAVPQTDTFERKPTRGPVERPARRRLHAAKPGAEYVYRARSGNGAWSPEIKVRMAAPKAPPPAPTAIAAAPTSPFAVRVTWDADARSAAGFELAVESKGEFVRAAIVDPTEREFVHHHRLPGRAYAYRVRAFNAAGASTPSAVAAVTTPERAEPPAPAPKPPPCTRLPPAVDPAKVRGMGRDVLSSGSRTIYNDPEGTNGLRRHLYGEYEGCLRDFGAFSLQADVSEVPGFSDEGYPLLYAIAGAGQYVGAQILTLRFARGRYAVADTALFCGDPWPDPSPSDPGVGAEGPGDALTSFAP
ncbi:MAG TPA: fibronectin type III domain-containing protein, partial [Polyangiaceae bacterium]|nr:fibronectin type III domain-containing protein [Polyangiaceae bacterium]